MSVVMRRDDNVIVADNRVSGRGRWQSLSHRKKGLPSAISSLVKGDLLGLDVGVNLPEVVPVRGMRLLLDGTTKRCECLWYLLSSITQDPLEFPGVGLVVLGEERDALACPSSTTRSADAMDVILDGQREGVVDWLASRDAREVMVVSEVAR